MWQSHRQHLKTVGCQLLNNELLQIGSDQFQPSETRFNGYFPAAGSAEKYFIGTVLYDFPGAFGNPGVLVDPPNERVGVQQRLQSSKAFCRSSGRGASKSG